MTNSRAATAAGYQLLHTHKATGTEATYTYTPASALNMATKYIEIKIIFMGKATAALTLHMKLNALTDYNATILTQDTTTLVQALIDADTTHELINTTILDAAAHFSGTISIICPIAELVATSNFTQSKEGAQFGQSTTTAGITTITSINFATSTSTWIAGTEILVYGLLR